MTSKKSIKTSIGTMCKNMVSATGSSDHAARKAGLISKIAQARATFPEMNAWCDEVECKYGLKDVHADERTSAMVERVTVSLSDMIAGKSLAMVGFGSNLALGKTVISKMGTIVQVLGRNEYIEVASAGIEGGLRRVIVTHRDGSDVTVKLGWIQARVSKDEDGNECDTRYIITIGENKESKTRMTFTASRANHVQNVARYGLSAKAVFGGA